MIRLGIVGCNYGRAVQLPAFRADSRCRVMALAGSDAARTAELAHQSEIPEAYGDWRQMIARADIDAIAIATPPRLQPEIAIAALKSGHIRHAGLDVFHNEPLPPTHPLAKLDNVTLSAHAAFRTPEASETLLRRAIDIVKKIVG